MFSVCITSGSEVWESSELSVTVSLMVFFGSGLFIKFDSAVAVSYSLCSAAY